MFVIQKAPIKPVKFLIGPSKKGLTTFSITDAVARKTPPARSVVEVKTAVRQPWTKSNNTCLNKIAIFGGVSESVEKQGELSLEFLPYSKPSKRVDASPIKISFFDFIDDKA
jgi:hypothetical protein